MVVWVLLLVATISLHAHATNLTLNQKLTFDSLDNDEIRLRRDASWAAGLIFGGIRKIGFEN
jgi:hypothetical protein